MANDFNGDWDTDYGPMTIEVNGSYLWGEYGSLNGEIEGTVSGPRATGRWTQRAAGGNGATWGTFAITLTRNGDAFTGTWNYEDDLAPEGGTWSGERE